tara:strand:- start:16 stop:627 length:612 start_codon:yes stop_codon:yes gene_type:complete
MPDKPIPKPYTAEQFKKSADTLLQGIYGTGPSSNNYLIGLIEETLNKGVKEGAITMEEGLDFIKERKKYYDTELGKQDQEIKQMPPSYRTNFLEGGDTKYNVMVTEMYIKSGGQEGTGMDIDTFAKKYFPKMAKGGRIGFDKGTMPESERWMRDYFFSGKGGYDDRMSYKEFALGPGQELFKRFNRKNGGKMYGKYAKQILSS